MAECANGKWLLLIHQIPPKPGYLRVKIWRRLQGLGAVAIKNSVYVIPRSDQTLEDFQWVLREIVQAGAEASICAASFVEGLTDEHVEALFRTARDADYGQIAEEAKAVFNSAPPSASMTEEDRSELEAALTRLKKRFSVVSKVDFFGAPGGESASTLLEKLEFSLAQARRRSDKEHKEPDTSDLTQFQGRTWVTRKGVYVDRIACAWLIRRFIDRDGSFRFVSERGHRPKTAELRFDMFEGEFTHEGDLCSFEVLLRRFALQDKALLEIGRIVHDLDLKDAKFSKAETAGVSALLDGMVASCKADDARLDRGSALFDDLYEYFRRK
ncbi:MAG: chromate resistance protein [Desulfomonile tiedjei]|uniref:Chromate resistance protein n=1 Tax=Desulfomonile tiedjei TaxID=2358 RepID=A0A9D6Z5P1_9BACT|nr:chromate resistance protein [Desulfomonile tiedjei]